MNYSDFDSDGYSSNEDEDYVPSEDNLSEDDVSKCEKEEPLEDTDSIPHPEDMKKKKGVKVRKRKKLMLKVESTEKEEAGEPLKELGHSSSEQKEEEEVEKEKQKKRSDELWESFLQDVGSRPKDSTIASASAQKGESSTPPRTLVQDAAPATVTITKVFDFAGEEVRVNKEVSADSKEAKSYQRSQSVTQNRRANHESCSSSQAPPPALSAKRPAGLSHLLGAMAGKKSKLSTLEKSKMDWDAFKSEEGITEELAIHNRGRDGYVERKNFLERVDHRQFEREKAVRLSNMKQ